MVASVDRLRVALEEVVDAGAVVRGNESIELREFGHIGLLRPLAGVDRAEGTSNALTARVLFQELDAAGNELFALLFKELFLFVSNGSWTVLLGCKQ